jgi:serine/threonine protein kinase
MGQVYRARDARLGRDVAIKTLPAIFGADAERVARFEREARLLATLNHPNIAAIHGVGEHQWMWALVLELVDGETLADRIARTGASRQIVRLPPATQLRGLSRTLDGSALIVGVVSRTGDIILADRKE